MPFDSISVAHDME